MLINNRKSVGLKNLNNSKGFIEHSNTKPNERHSNKTVSIFILKTIYFILQNMFRSLHTSSTVVHIKSTVNIQIIRVCYNVTVSLKCNLKTFI